MSLDIWIQLFQPLREQPNTKLWSNKALVFGFLKINKPCILWTYFCFKNHAQLFKYKYEIRKTCVRKSIKTEHIPKIKGFYTWTTFLPWISQKICILCCVARNAGTDSNTFTVPMLIATKRRKQIRNSGAMKVWRFHIRRLL